jgi:integrase/recombinase XerD
MTSKHVIYSELYQSEVQSFYDYLKTVGCNEKHRRSKYLNLKEFFCFMESRNIFELQQITPFDVSEFYSHLRQRQSLKNGQLLSERFVYRIMRSVQEYFGYALALGKTGIHPASHLKFRSRKPRTERPVLTQDNIRELYLAAETLQQRAMLHIGYGCGLRVGEISALNIADIHAAENRVVVRSGKMGKRRVVPINDAISAELQKFIFSDERKNELTDCGADEAVEHVFYDSTGSRIQQWTLNKWLKKMIGRTGFGKRLTNEELTKIGVHTLRHSIATHLLENGMKIEQVQQFLGHSQPETTEIYTHIRQYQINHLFNLKT